MEFTNLLNEQGWDQSGFDYSKDKIDKATRKKIDSRIRILIRNYMWSLLLNVLFLIGSVAIYIVKPTPEFLLPAVIVSGCFIFMLGILLRNFRGAYQLETTGNLKDVLTNILAFNNRLNAQIKRFLSVLMAASFSGGFILGIAAQGWSFEKMGEHPIIFVALVVLVVPFYWITTKPMFAESLEKMNPRYHKTKAYLEQLLGELEAEGDE